MNRLQDLFLQALFGALLWVGISACSGGREAHFMTDAAYRAQVQQDFEARMAANGGALARFAEIPGQAGNDDKGQVGSDGTVMAGTDRPSLA